MTADDKPLCRCHGEPMVKNGQNRGRQTFVCAIRKSAANRRFYEAEPGIAYNRRLLRMRRTKALLRRAARIEREET